MLFCESKFTIYFWWFFFAGLLSDGKLVAFLNFVTFRVQLSVSEISWDQEIDKTYFIPIRENKEDIV
uniref:Uncharacterized protein n=1 Tax=Caenorhabditis japonica TaxID=281687 RepID=A0A8R1I9Y3_CAEJA